MRVEWRSHDLDDVYEFDAALDAFDPPLTIKYLGSASGDTHDRPLGYYTSAVLPLMFERSLDLHSLRSQLIAEISKPGSEDVTMLIEDGKLSVRIDDSEICGFCGLPGADKIPHPIHWPGEQSAGTEFVHAECEAEECQRAHAAMTDDERCRFLGTCR